MSPLACDPSWPPSTSFTSWCFKRVMNIHLAYGRNIYHPATKQSTWNLSYSHSHYIISQKEAKRYFNKTHCSVTFDPLSVDLIPFTLARDSGGHVSVSLPIVKTIHLQSDESVIWQEPFGLLIFICLNPSFHKETKPESNVITCVFSNPVFSAGFLPMDNGSSGFSSGLWRAAG